MQRALKPPGHAGPTLGKNRSGCRAHESRGTEFSPASNTGFAPGTQSATGFQLSSTEASGESVLFGFEDDLLTFSPERIFAPTDGTVFDVTFIDPADQTTPARGLGIVFSNVIEPTHQDARTVISLFT